MWKSVKSIFNRYIGAYCLKVYGLLSPKISSLLGKNATLSFFFIGVVMVAVSSVYMNENNNFKQAISNLGTVIIGGGFFSAITRTKQYTDFFQKRIFDVFFEPQKHISEESLKDKWIILTRAILKKSTNSFHGDAAKEIYERFICLKNDYHFSDMDVKFEIELHGDIAHVSQRVITNVVANDDCDNIVMNQVFRDHKENGRDEYLKLTEVFLNNKPIDIPIIETDEQGKYVSNSFQIPINTSEIKIHKLERTFEYKQNILIDSVFSTEYSRFVKGLHIKYKAKGCTVQCILMGKSSFSSTTAKEIKDTNNYIRIEASSAHELTLPWQGFMLIVTHEKGSEQYETSNM